MLVKGKSTPGKSEHRLSFQKTSVEKHGLEPEAMTSPWVLVKSAGSRLNTTHAPLETREPKKNKKKKRKKEGHLSPCLEVTEHDVLQEALCREGQISKSVLLGLP